MHFDYLIIALPWLVTGTGLGFLLATHNQKNPNTPLRWTVAGVSAAAAVISFLIR